MTAPLAVAPTLTHWQELAPGYDHVMGRDTTMHALLRAVDAEVPLDADPVLDLGTGTGRLLAVLRTRRPRARLTGLDPAPAMLEQAAENLAGVDAELVEGSAAALGFGAEAFGAVVSNFALHHLSHEDKRACAREVMRVLRPGGVFAFGDQHARRMGDPSDRDWVADTLDLFCSKARYFQREVSHERMMLQLTLLPRLVTADGEVVCTPEFWLDCLADAGFEAVRTIVVEPASLMHRVIVARKPEAAP